MYAVISDIHGNLEALEAVLRNIPEEVRIVYCLGDVIGYGANPDECCDIVRASGMPVISGNHDLAVTDLETDLNWFNPVAAAAVLWTREHLSKENADFLRSRPRLIETRDALFVHGSVRDPEERISGRPELLFRAHARQDRDPLAEWVRDRGPHPRPERERTIPGEPRLGRPAARRGHLRLLRPRRGRARHLPLRRVRHREGAGKDPVRRPPRHARRPAGRRPLRTNPGAWNPPSPGSSPWRRRTPSFPS